MGGDVFELEFLGVGVGEFRYHIGLNATVVDIAAAGGEVFGDRHGHARTIREPPHRLHQALTEGFLAHQQGPMVVLKGTGENFASAGRPLIDQDHQGALGEGMAIGPLDVLDAITGFGGHDHALIEPLAGDCHTRHQQAAGVAAQVEHVALHPLGFEVLHGRSHVPGRIGVELLQADIAQAFAIGRGFHLVLHRVELNPFAHQGRGNQGSFTA